MVRSLRRSIGTERRLLAAKTQFLDVVAHVFRTPITEVRWWAESWIERKASMSEQDQRAIVDTYAAVLRLQIGFDNVLAAQEIIQGQLPSDPRPCDLARMLQDAVHQMLPIAEYYGVVLEAPALQGPVAANVVERKVLKIVRVLIANGILYNRHGGVVRVEAHVEAGRLLLTVTDDGIGIQKQELERVFEPFYRGEMAKKKYVEGIGLGLFIAKAYTRDHGGDIAITSEPGVGTVARVILPLS
jgi:signal transduction histidine kinase